MATEISFFIPGEPVAKGRARSFIRNGKMAHATPDKTVRYESTVALFGTQAMAGKAPITGPVSVELFAFFSIPKSWSERNKVGAAIGSIACSKKPDIDNLTKIVFDGLNGVTWIDDAQIVDCRITKRFCSTPGIRINITELDIKSCQRK